MISQQDVQPQTQSTKLSPQKSRGPLMRLINSLLRLTIFAPKN